MNKIKIILGVLTLFFAIECSSNDDIGNEEITRLYKKSISYGNGYVTSTKTINYNSDNKIESITDFSANNKEIFNVSYSGNKVSTITHIGDPRNLVVNSLTYNVTYISNKITLKYGDHGIEITHTNGYVDSIKYFFVNMFLGENILTRDSNENLVSSYGTGERLISYSNFDSNKMNDPFGSVIDSYLPHDYIRILELKVTNSNPSTASYISGGETITYHDYLTYDELGYVIRTSYYGTGSTLAYEEHEYIEL